MEELIAIVAEFDVGRMNILKRTIHEEGIIELMRWKVRQIKRENPEIDEEGNIVERKPAKRGANTIDDLMLAAQVFTKG